MPVTRPRTKPSPSPRSRGRCWTWQQRPGPSSSSARTHAAARTARQPHPHRPDHGSCTVDFYWPQQHLIVETDSWRFHSTRTAYEHDRARDAALITAGHRVVRFTWRTPDPTIERRLRALLHH
jgi:very-short-patch-repair endonuclease